MTEPRVYWIEVCKSCGGQVPDGDACYRCMYKRGAGGREDVQVVSKDDYDRLALDEEYWKHQYWMLLTRLGSTLP